MNNPFTPDNEEPKHRRYLKTAGKILLGASLLGFAGAGLEYAGVIGLNRHRHKMFAKFGREYDPEMYFHPDFDAGAFYDV